MEKSIGSVSDKGWPSNKIVKSPSLKDPVVTSPEKCCPPTAASPPLQLAAPLESPFVALDKSSSVRAVARWAILVLVRDEEADEKGSMLASWCSVVFVSI